MGPGLTKDNYLGHAQSIHYQLVWGVLWLAEEDLVTYGQISELYEEHTTLARLCIQVTTL